MAPSKEDFMAKKLLCLEQRVTRVERLLETRFSEILEEYSNRVPPERPPTPPQVKRRVTIGSRSQAAPASVKRQRQAEESLPPERPLLPRRTFKKEAEGRGVVKDCSVHVERLDTPSSSTGGVASRTRRNRTPVVKEDFVSDIKRRTRSRREASDDDNGNDRDPTPTPVSNDNENEDCAYLDDYNDCGSGPASPVAADNDVGMEEDSYFVSDNQNSTVYQDEEEEEESYYTHPGTLRPVRPSRTGRRSANASINYDDTINENEFEEANEEVDEGDPADGDWSGGDDDDEVIEKSKKKRKRNRKYKKIGDIPKDAIKANDPNMKQCPVCHKHFKLDAEKFTAHVNAHSKARHHICPFPNCDKSYFSLVTLLRHKALHNPEKYGRKCRLCSKFFSRTDKALVHERLCAKRAAERGEEVNPLIIEDLERRTRGKWRWVAPTPKKQGAEERKSCPICQWTLIGAKALESHMKNHETGRNWTCNLCDKTFFNKPSLIIHISGVHPNAKAKKNSTSKVDQEVGETASEEGEDGDKEEENVSPSAVVQIQIKHEVHEAVDLDEAGNEVVGEGGMD
ncbi:unnamed protein product [Orchesella dallaii]|uniref:C2H2-type domain-containing protein n=1 Tax=Orchesella dallaii TaxID=48710 RepID=A0ABP1RQI4_9HEXA